jgi:hypothetical protein
VKRLARTTAVYGAAVAASGIAVVSAVEAWIRLQQLGGASSLVVNLADDVLLAVALPLLAIAVAIVLHRVGSRSSTGGRTVPDATVPKPSVEADDSAPALRQPGSR